MTVNLDKPQHRAFALPDLRPYIRPTGLGRALGTGSVTLGKRLFRKERLAKAVERARAWGIVSWPGAFCIACATVGAWMMVHRYVWLITGILAPLWMLLALMHSTPTNAPAEAPEALPAEDEEDAPENPREAFLDHLRQAIGDRNGVLLRDLAKQPPFDRCGIPGIRTVADHHGVPVRDRIKVSGQVSVGIAKADLSPLPQEEPKAAPLAG